MASKWKEILKGRNIAPFPLEAKFREKVDAAKTSFNALELKELAKAYNSLRNANDKHELKIKENNVELAAIDELMRDAMEAQGFESFRSNRGDTFYTEIEPYTSVTDRKVLFDWIKKTKSAYLLGVQWQTLNATVKDRLIKGEPPPPGVSVFLKTEIRRRRGK